MEIPVISKETCFFLLKTKNGKYYNLYIEEGIMDLYKTPLSKEIMSDYHLLTKQELKQKYNTSYEIQLVMDVLTVGDYIFMVSRRNKQLRIGRVIEKNLPCIQVDWYQTIETKQISELYPFLYRTSIFQDISLMKDVLIRLIYNLYQMEDHYHLIIHVTQSGPISFKSLTGLQRMIERAINSEDLIIKLSLESPGIIELITKHKETILIVLKVIQLIINYRLKANKPSPKDPYYEMYKAYQINQLNITCSIKENEK